MRRLLSILFVLFMPLSSFAITASQTGATVSVSYQEPDTNADGTLLQDLDHTNVMGNLGTGTVFLSTVTATALAGNGNISTSFTVPVSSGTSKTFSIWATATDISGNTSLPSNTVILTIDRLAPAPPR